MNRITSAAVSAAVRVARTHGIAVDAPVVLGDLFCVVVHLAPAPVVARIPTAVRRFRHFSSDDATWMTRELALATHLRGLGAPVVGPSTELPPGPHHRDGFTVSFWTYVEPDPRRTVTSATARRCCRTCTGRSPRSRGTCRGWGRSPST